MDTNDFDFDLFSPHIYKKNDYIFTGNTKRDFFFWPHRFFMIATAGMNFKYEKIQIEKNDIFMRNTLNSNSDLDILNPPFLEQILLEKYGTQEELNRHRSTYMRTFNEYAKKGIFAYDKTFINNKEDKNFHLVAYPKLDVENYKLLAEFANRNLSLNIPLHFEDGRISEYLEKLETSIQKKGRLYNKFSMSTFNVFK